MTTHNQFIRKAKLLIGGDTKGIDLSELQFSFQIRQAQLATPQFATVRIYNISATTAQTIKANEYTRLIIEAGYQHGAFGVIFDGELIQARLGRESAVDTFMDIIASEGYSANQAVIGTTLAAGATGKDAANAAAGSMSIPIKFYDYDPTVKLPRGQVLYGMARDVLHKTAATAGYSYFYQNGQIVWIPLQGYKDGSAAVMNATTGMIGWPEQTQDGIKVRCLLDPLIEVGSRLQIDNASILRAQYSADISFIAGSLPSLDADGIYRVCVVEHHGDTRGREWYSDIICVSIDPANAGLTGLVQKGQFS